MGDGAIMSEMDQGGAASENRDKGYGVKRIAFPVQDHLGLDDMIFEHFGHAPAYLLIDISQDGTILKTEVLDNPYQGEHDPGVIPSLLANAGVDVLICRGMGRRAVEYFQQYGVAVIRGAYGKVRDVLEMYLANTLVSTEYKPSKKWKDEHESGGL